MAARTLNPRKFVDSLRIHVKGGTGGRGLPRYGGLGGRGGNIYAVCEKNSDLKMLREISPNLRFVGGLGNDSKRHRLVGDPGSDVILPAPPGVIIRLESGRVIGELNDHGDEVMIVKGADGACPKKRFVQEKGHAFNVTLDLKLIADIGLVGFPNAGKSTILTALSRATPKIAAYPFTTMQPNIGVLEYEDQRQIKMADLPGLIEGAHINIGMGHKFLKHVERTKILMFMIDLHGFRLKLESPLRSPFQTIVLLMKELELYKRELVNKPAVLVLNKVDIPGSRQLADDVIYKLQNFQDSLRTDVEEPLWPDKQIEFLETFIISAKDQVNTEHVKERLREILDDLADAREDPKSFDDLETKLAKSLTENRQGRHLV